MPHKDRATRLAYLKRWKERGGRPSPKPEPQGDAGLPPRGAMHFSLDGEKVQCHVCGQWFGALNTHLKSHGLDAASYKEAYGIGRTHSLLPPAVKDRYREAAIERDQGELGKVYLPRGVTRPKGLEQRLSVKIEASTSRKGQKP